MQQNAQNFVNPAFAEIYEGITSKMPTITFYGVIGTYLVTAALNVHFIPLPFFISIPAALALQFGRFAVVFTDYLNPTGHRSPWPPLIAALATIVALTELWFSCEAMKFSPAEHWAVFLFGAGVVTFGYLLEINFISKGAEAFGLGHGKRPQGVQGIPQAQPAQAPHQPQAAPQAQPATPAPIPFTWPKPQPNGNGVHTNQGPTNRVHVAHLGSHVTQPLITEPLGNPAPGNSKLIKDCEHCGQTYQAKVIWQRFCSADCKEQWHTAQHGQAFNPKRYHKQKV